MNIDTDILLSRLESLCNRNKITLNSAFVNSGVGKNFKSNLKTSNPSMGKLTMLANYFNVTVDYLLGNSDTPTPGTEIESNAVILDPEKTRMVPVFESVSAGFGVIAQDLILEYMPLYISSDLEAEDTICIKVKGDSMSPDIEDGDIIQVYKTSDVENGNVAVVLVDGEEALVKTVYFKMASVELCSRNPAYPPITFKGAALSRIQIVGVVRNTIKNAKVRHAEPLFTKREAALIELLRQIPEDRQEAFLEMGEVYAKSLKKD